MKQKRVQFNAVYERNKDVVLTYLRHQIPHEADRDEVFQEVWLDFYLALDRGRPEQPRPFLLKIARRRVARMRRTGSVRRLEESAALTAPTSTDELGAILDQALHTLPAEKRDVFILKHRLGLDYREIATVLEIPLGTVKSRMHHAIADLKTAMRRAGFDCRIGESA